MRRSVLLFTMLAACTGDAGRDAPADTGPNDEPVDVRDVAFAPELNVNLDDMTRLEDGVHFQDVRQGSGRVVMMDDIVTVEYRAWLPDGTLFEQRPSPEGFGPSEFVPAVSAPVPGLAAGMDGMRQGGVRRILVPPEHGYGLVGRPDGVPPDVPLLFEVRVLRVNG
jgi:FKBP-type peptidyl-prolyl cis-trans isomerase